MLADAKVRLAAIADPAERTFDNTMRALDEFTEPLDYAMAVVRYLYDPGSWLGDGTVGNLANAVAAWEWATKCAPHEPLYAAQLARTFALLHQPRDAAKWAAKEVP